MSSSILFCEFGDDLIKNEEYENVHIYNDTDYTYWYDNNGKEICKLKGTFIPINDYFYSDDNSKGDIFEYFNFDNSNEIDECIDIAEKFQKYGKKTGTVKITDAEAKDIVKFFKNANILFETSSYSLPLSGIPSAAFCFRRFLLISPS